MSRNQYLERRCLLLLPYPCFVLLTLLCTTVSLTAQKEVKTTDWSLSGQTGYFMQFGGTNGMPLGRIDASEGYAYDLVLEARRAPGFSFLLTQSLRFSDERFNGIGGTSYFLPVRGQLTHYELLVGLQGNLRIGAGDLSLSASVGPGRYWYRRQLPTGLLASMDAFSERALVERYRGVLHLGGRLGVKYTHWLSPDFGMALGGNFILSAIAPLGGTERLDNQEFLVLRDRSTPADTSPVFAIPEPTGVPDRILAMSSVTPSLNFFLGFTFNL
ncbi:hypothetical protein [Lewinella sp. W8]|uniref:hypothetical protein n=1 Tax=Lewinella sp. W8 TaxID=2528208 RepID=UPI0010671E1C|nr:hypothetical protein [Lewinella sp. W8]MTB51651.1 hypothetical protein [Lewinella sp. W8]